MKRPSPGSPSFALRAVAPHWGALLALALFLGAGLAILDDYGVWANGAYQRWLGGATLAHLAGEANALPTDHNRFYGAAFDGTLRIGESIFGLKEGRGAWLSIHLLTHLFYLVGGLFAYLLARRLFGGKAIAVFAMLLFLLHPRLYAHSFFNTKDIPFFTMFVITLYLTHRAFARDKVSAFMLLGFAVGVLLNLRIMGLVAFTAIFGFLALDFVAARGWMERKRALLAAGAFALTGALTVYALLPHLWPDPLRRSVDWWATLSSHPSVFEQAFRGVVYRSADFPWEYVPVSFSISSPPFALFLGAIGVMAVLARGAKAPWLTLRNARLRFGPLLIMCFVLPNLAVVLFDVNIYDGWRHLFFLWAPFSLLAAFGLQEALSAFGRGRLRRAALVGALASLALTVISMALIHPNQSAYFNFLVDRVAPEHLRRQYDMGESVQTARLALKWFSENAVALGDGEPLITGTAENLVRGNATILPKAERDRLSANLSLDGFTLGVGFGEPWGLETYKVKVYDNTILAMQMKPDLGDVYEKVASKEPMVRSFFNVYYEDEAVIYVKEPCNETEAMLDGNFIIDFIPHRNEDLRSADHRAAGFERLMFKFTRYGAAFDGKCVAAVPAPYYSVAAIRTSQSARKVGTLIWEAEFRADAAYQDIYAKIRQEEPAARSVFDIHLADGALVYVKEPCAPSDADLDFFLHLFPERIGDLPEDRKQHGFDNPGFHSLLRRGAVFDGKCVASVPLPDYAIAAARTGQRTEDGAVSWETAFSFNPEPYAAAYAEARRVEPAARSVFDVHLADGALVYAKSPCDQRDTEARFFLHITPERAGDLPEARRDARFDNLDFDFFLHGSYFNGNCAAKMPLPDYSIAGIRTGQFASGAGEIWDVEFEVER